MKASRAVRKSCCHVQGDPDWLLGGDPRHSSARTRTSPGYGHRGGHEHLGLSRTHTPSPNSQPCNCGEGQTEVLGWTLTLRIPQDLRGTEREGRGRGMGWGRPVLDWGHQNHKTTLIYHFSCAQAVMLGERGEYRRGQNTLSVQGGTQRQDSCCSMHCCLPRIARGLPWHPKIWSWR